MQKKFVLKKSLFTTKYKNQGSQMVLATPVRSFYLQNARAPEKCRMENE